MRRRDDVLCHAARLVLASMLVSLSVVSAPVVALDDRGLIDAQVRPRLGAAKDMQATPLSDSFFVFNHVVTTPTAFYNAPGKVGATMELGAYVVGASVAPTGMVTIHLGTQSCGATLTPESTAEQPNLNPKATTGYCTIVPDTAGLIELSGSYEGDSNNAAGAVGQFLSSEYPLVPIHQADEKGMSFVAAVIANALTHPDFAFTLQPAVSLTPGMLYKVRVTTEAVDALGVPMFNLAAPPAGFVTE